MANRRDVSIVVVRARIEEGDAGSVEEITTALLAENPNWRLLALFPPPIGDDIDQRIFRTLITSHQVSHLSIPAVPEMDVVVEMFRQAITTLPTHLYTVQLALVNMSEPEAETIISILRMRPTLSCLHLWLGNATFGTVRLLSRYLQEAPSVPILALSWARPDEAAPQPVDLPRQVVTTICEGIAASTSLSCTDVFHSPAARDAEFVAESIVRASIASTSVNAIRILLRDLSCQSFAQQIRSYLLQSEAIRNFDLCFREVLNENGNDVAFVLNRNAQWRQFLGVDDVPLNFWPVILAETNAWSREASHGPLDFLFFLMKEKKDVLLQNVHQGRL